jgi:glycosyltransferase involved in cell wall biosynthesis
VRVRVPKKPLFLLFLTYHLVAPIVFWLYKLRHRVHYDIVQGVESKSLHASLSYAHFCHRAYLQDHWKATRPSGLRGAARWLNHISHSMLEPLVYRKVRQTVVPSHGLERELSRVYGAALEGKIHVISNPINVERMKPPADFEREQVRRQWNFDEHDLVLVFVALGHFERKGLPVVLEAMEMVADSHVKLVVVGGVPGLIKEYQGRAATAGIDKQVHFVGMQHDVRPYLWASDLFVFPSSYETFSLVAHEAAAAELPLLTSPLYGVEEWLTDGVNGWCVERKPEALADKIRISLNNRPVLKEMGQRAAESVQRYDVNSFVERWRTFYQQWV